MSKVLIVIPCLNEAAHIEGLVRQLVPVAQRLDGQIVIADGGSTDGSREIARRMADAEDTVTLLHNPARLQSAAVNLAVAEYGAQATYLIRIDAHAAYPDDYCDVLLGEAVQTQAASVVTGMLARGTGPMQSAIAAAQNSRLGNGGSKHRNAPVGQYVDHGHHALMQVAAFRAVGGYDESFTHNEDAELDMRLRAAGYDIWLTPHTLVTYYPRATLGALARQYLNYGAGRARTVLKHRVVPKLRQAVVLSVMPALALVPLALWLPVFALPALLWLLACLAGGLAIAWEARRPALALSGGAAAVMHTAWSAGFWASLLRERRQARKAVPG